jgi:hypothetical protein
VPVVDDFAGNSPSGVASYQLTSATFTVAFTAPGVPGITGVTPPDGSSNVPLNVRIQARFDQPVLADSLAGLALSENGVAIPMTAQVEADGRTVSAIPVQLPSAGSTYNFTVAGVQNTEGSAMAGVYQTSFTIGSTLDYNVPVFRSSPANGQTEVPVNTAIRLRSNKPLNGLTVNTRSVLLTRSPFNNSLDAGVQLQDSGQTIVITPTDPLSTGLRHIVTLTGVTDLAGNSAGGLFSFTTTDGAPAPVTLLAVDPVNGATNFPATGTVQALFSQPVDLTLGDTSFSVTGPNGPVPGAINATGGLLSFRPAQSLQPGAWQAQLNGLQDVAGNPLAPVSWTFSVPSAAPDLGPLRLISSSPAFADAGVPVSSTVALNFNKAVSAVSAAQLHLVWQGGSIPGTFQTDYTNQGSTVTFTPAAALPGAASLSLTGTLRDLNGFSSSVNLQFTTGANPDRIPPVLVSSYPADGATVFPFDITIALRFSKPVAAAPGTNGIQIFAGANLLPSSSFTVGEDGQTFTTNQNIGPGTQITVFVTSNMRDFAGNAVEPFSIHFVTASDTVSRGPSVLSVSPADGAVNVDVNSPIEIRFAQPMDAVSVQNGFDVTASGTLAGGALTNDSSARTFDFQPNLPWLPGAAVETFLTPLAHDLTGAQMAAAHTQFTTAAPPAATARAVAYSASARGVDVRFAGSVPYKVNQAYLRQGRTLLPSSIGIVGMDQIRLTPAAPLEPGVPYRLVLDADQELAFQVETPGQDSPTVTEVATGPAGFRLRFSRGVNPLSLRLGATRIVGPDGSNVGFTVRNSLDSRELFLVPTRSAGPLQLVLENLETRDGQRIPAQTPVKEPR